MGTAPGPLHRSRQYLTLTVNVMREADAACLTSPGARAAATCWACPGLRLSFGDLARGTGPVDRGTHRPHRQVAAARSAAGNREDVGKVCVFEVTSNRPSYTLSLVACPYLPRLSRTNQ